MKRYPPPKQGPHTGWSPNRDRAAQAKVRKLRLRVANGRCEIQGCETPVDRLQFHHDRAGYDINSGRILCHQHHKQADKYAR